MQNILTKPKIIALIAVLGLGMTGFIIYATTLFAAAPEQNQQADHQNHETASGNSLENMQIETAATEATDALGNSNNSLPGEIISYSDLQAYPSREGQIASWKVKIGDNVRKGQLLASLNPPPVGLELTSLLAEKQQAIVIAKAQAAATEKLVATSKQRLNEISDALERSRDTAVSVTEKEAVQNVAVNEGANQELEALKVSREATIKSAQAELLQAEQLLPIKLNAVRASIVTLANRFSGALSSDGTAPVNASMAGLMHVNIAYGVLSGQTLTDYINALVALLKALENPTVVPEKEANVYIQASLKLLATSSTTPDVTVMDISDLRDIIVEDQRNYLDALNDYKEAEADLDVSKARLTKMTAEADRDIAAAETSVRNSQTLVETNENYKQYQIAEADKELAKEKADLDLKVAELDRELAAANAQVAGAASAYAVVAGGGAGINILAPAAGTVSAIYKNVGDFVVPDGAVAMISNKNSDGKFVRFRISGDLKLPAAQDEVTIEKPGFPLDKKKAKITGVGLALDDSGFYQAEARFVEPIDWPVKTSVRVIIPQAHQSLVVPLTAVWWDDSGKANLWIVSNLKTIEARPVQVGKAIGDRIEVEAGLESGEQFVSVTKPEYKSGQSVAEGLAQTTPQTTSQDMKGMEGMAGMEGMDHEGH